jgi:hypothetical protein
MGSNFAYAGATPVMVQHISDEPVVSADSVPGYGPIFNAGVIHQDGRFHLFARGAEGRCLSRPLRAARAEDDRGLGVARGDPVGLTAGVADLADEFVGGAR